jgi:hypothetical protein
MTQYVGCDQARDLLDGLIDDELSMNDQLAVESHLRWCRTCALRIEDMRLIGSALRAGSAANGPDGHRDPAVAAINDAVLMRLRAERDQSFGVRLRELFVDRRLLWPAVGATAAVMLCVGVASSVLHASAAERPDSLAAMIGALGNPGSERNPLRPADNGVSIPRMPGPLDEGGAMEFEEAMPEEDGVYLVRTVVDRDGRVANYEVLLDGGGATARRRPERPGHDKAVRDVIRETRFTPAQTPLGHAVAVDVVWMIAKTTAVVLPTLKVEVSVTERRHRDEPKPAVQDVPDPPGHTSTNQRLSRYRRPLATA